MKWLLAAAVAASLGMTSVAAQAADPGALRTTAEHLRDEALQGSLAYPLLRELTTEIGPRSAGSDSEHRAALWAVDKLRAVGFENVHIESFPLTAWRRGEEWAQVTSPAPQPLVVTALGGSVATPPGGIEAEVALFHTYADLLAAPPGSLKGRIAVVTEPMARTQDGSGYGASFAIRGEGAFEAARRGAVAYLMRSLATGESRLPHTGMMRYAADAPRIPAAALSVADAEQLDRLTALGRPVRLRLVLTPSVVPNARSETVVAEIRGRERPDEIVLIGGHLDSWDLGTGAIDDGAGVAITTAAAKLIRDLPERPRRTIRLALFGAEEVDASNAAYATQHSAEQARHVIASECDLGADRVYDIQLPDGAAESAWGKTLGAVVAPLSIFVSSEPARNGGSDLEKLAGVPLASLNQDATHYFDIHHSADDTLDKISAKTMDQATAAWAAFTYLAADSDVDFRSLRRAAPPAAR